MANPTVPTMFPGELKAYEDTLDLDTARAEVRRSLDLEIALRTALHDLPEVPPRAVLLFLSHAAIYPDDAARGTRMQRQFGLEAIPAKRECELGAGLWQRLRAGLLASATVLALLLVPPPALAQSSSNCSLIRDGDLRAACRATTTGQESNCSLIGDGDLRAACRGLTTGRSSNCSMIRDPDARALCRAQTR